MQTLVERDCRTTSTSLKFKVLHFLDVRMLAEHTLRMHNETEDARRRCHIGWASARYIAGRSSSGRSAQDRPWSPALPVCQHSPHSAAGMPNCTARCTSQTHYITHSASHSASFRWNPKEFTNLFRAVRKALFVLPATSAYWGYHLGSLLRVASTNRRRSSAFESFYWKNVYYL